MAIINGNTGNTLAGGQSRFQNFSTTSNRPDGLSQQIQQPYIQDGLTYKSNNKFVMQRDDAGNIIIDPQNIQHLVIEPTIERVLNKSFLEVSKPQFNYFKFPAKSINDNSKLGFDDLALDVDIQEQDVTDSFNSRYIIPIPYSDDGRSTPSIWARLPVGVRYTPDSAGYNFLAPTYWFSKNTTGGGQADDWQKSWYTNGNDPNLWSWQRVPFTGVALGTEQSEQSTYILTPEIIDGLKESGKTLKFKINIHCYITAAGYAGSSGQQYGNETSAGIYLSRTMPSAYRSNLTASPSGQAVYSTQFPPFVINTYTIGGSGTNPGNPLYTSLTMEYIIDANEAQPYDKFSVYFCNSYKSYILRDTCYWDIEVIDDPGNGNYGVQ